MKILLTAVALTGMVEAADFTKKAKVTNVSALTETFTTSTPFESCTTHKVWVQDSNIGNQLFGALLGGAIGNQFGGGNGKTIATGAGAVIGSQLAAGDPNQGHFERKQVCETKYKTSTETVTSGYDVTFKLNGQEHSVIMNSRPGRYVTVGLNIESIE
jgi:uncharacterized protein YcfJ